MKSPINTGVIYIHVSFSPHNSLIVILLYRPGNSGSHVCKKGQAGDLNPAVADSACMQHVEGGWALGHRRAPAPLCLVSCLSCFLSEGFRNGELRRCMCGAAPPSAGRMNLCHSPVPSSQDQSGKAARGPHLC